MIQNLSVAENLRFHWNQNVQNIYSNQEVKELEIPPSNTVYESFVGRGRKVIQKAPAQASGRMQVQCISGLQATPSLH